MKIIHTGFYINSSTPTEGYSYHDLQNMISSTAARRYTPMVYMGTATALKVCEGYQPEGIVMGTGHGCFNNAEKFTASFKTNPEALISPNPFIQSTDNTIAGQIALLKECRGLNITYANRGFAWINVLTEIQMMLETQPGIYLGGVCDERLNGFELNSDFQRKFPKHKLSEGAAFMLLGPDDGGAGIYINQFGQFFGTQDEFILFLKTFQFKTIRKVDTFPSLYDFPQQIEHIPVEDYTPTTGINASAFGFLTSLSAMSEAVFPMLLVNRYDKVGFEYIILEKR